MAGAETDEHRDRLLALLRAERFPGMKTEPEEGTEDA